MSVLVAQFKEIKDANFIARLIEMIQGRKGKVNVMTDEEWEDYVLGQMAEKSEKEGGSVPRQTISRHFKKHGVNF